MTDVSKLLGELSPEQWKLLQLRLKKKQPPQDEPDRAGRIPPRAPGPLELPLSFSQQRLWFLDQWEPGNPAYNVFAAFRLEGILDPSALSRSIEEIVRRHESLRTTFTSEAGKPRQVVSPPRPVPLPFVDLSGLPPERSAVEVRRLGAGHAARPFDLERGPLLRTTLVRLAPADHWALLSVHHIVSDGWSMGVFNRELAALYTAYRQGAISPLAPLAIQYPDYSLWQREWLAGETLREQLDFWRGLLSGAPPLLDLPLDHPRGALPGAPAASLPVRISREVTNRLQALASTAGGTLFMALLAGFSALLARYTGNPDVVVGAPVANRNRSDVEGLIGFFVNTLALRVNTAGDPSGSELVRRARQVASGAYDHQDVPFELPGRRAATGTGPLPSTVGAGDARPPEPAAPVGGAARFAAFRGTAGEHGRQVRHGLGPGRGAGGVGRRRRGQPRPVRAGHRRAHGRALHQPAPGPGGGSRRTGLDRCRFSPVPNDTSWSSPGTTPRPPSRAIARSLSSSKSRRRRRRTPRPSSSATRA